MRVAQQSRRSVVRGGLALAGLSLLSGCRLGSPWTRAPVKVARIAFIGHPTIPESWIGQFKDGMLDHGYVEGETYVIERRFTDGDEARLPELAAELIGIPVDVLVTRGAPPALVAMQLTSTIPIVASGSADPVGQGLVNSLSRPGGNVTALIANGVEMAPKCLEILKDAFPGITRVAVFLHPSTPGSARQWEGVRAAAPKLGVSVQAVEVFDEADIEAGFMAAAGRVDAILTMQSAVIQSHTTRIIALAAQHRLPSIYQAWPYVTNGSGLMSYEAEYPHGQYRRTADYVTKILDGEKVGELPVEAPTHFRLTINLKTAEALGLTIPPSVLQQATELIQ